MKTACLILTLTVATLHAANVSLDLSKQKLGEAPNGFTARLAGVGEAGTAIFMHGLTPHASATNRSSLSRRTLILSYRAADAMPLYFGPNTVRSENQSRLVRGEFPWMARFTLKEFPIPRYREPAASLYKLQEQTRRVAAEETPSGK